MLYAGHHDQTNAAHSNLAAAAVSVHSHRHCLCRYLICPATCCCAAAHHKRFVRVLGCGRRHSVVRLCADLNRSCWDDVHHRRRTLRLRATTAIAGQGWTAPSSAGRLRQSLRPSSAAGARESRSLPPFGHPNPSHVIFEQHFPSRLNLTKPKGLSQVMTSCWTTASTSLVACFFSGGVGACSRRKGLRCVAKAIPVCFDDGASCVDLTAVLSTAAERAQL